MDDLYDVEVIIRSKGRRAEVRGKIAQLDAVEHDGDTYTLPLRFVPDEKSGIALVIENWIPDRA